MDIGITAGGVMMQFNSIGKNIRRYRQEKKLRQDDLAEKAGLSSNYIGMVERGEKIPSLETFINIINALEVSADMVLCDVIDTGFTVKTTILTEKIKMLDTEDRERIFNVLESLLHHWCRT